MATAMVNGVCWKNNICNDSVPCQLRSLFTVGTLAEGETLSWQSSVLAKPLPSGSTHGELDAEIAVTGNQSLTAGVGDAWSQTNR